MKHFLAPTVVCLIAGYGAAASPPMVPYAKQWAVKLHGLPAGEVLTKLDLHRPGLETVKAAADRGNRTLALTELLRYYRGKYPSAPTPSKESSQSFEAADRLCRHVFQWGPYKPADYGAGIDWTINPADDIEWVAAVYRFYWATDLASAYTATRDDKYARAFVELTADWIAKHPLDDWTRTHPTLTRWKGFAWLDLQTGIRATRAVSGFKAMVHSNAFTPEFLAIFLASMYDHQCKTEMVPMGQVHNKAIFEQCGVLNVCHAFPEFTDTARWAKLAIERAGENLLAQTTSEGVQKEWCGSYHLAVLNDSINIMEKAAELGLTVPDDVRRRICAMCDYVFGAATPDLAWPMFGDTRRSDPAPEDPRSAQLYDPLIRFSKLWDDPKYAARAMQDTTALPKQTSYAFESAGVYVMRSRWDAQGAYLALHCPPPALSGHDQPDNGTFELYAHGRWLMTDTGFYTYGHDREARAWHRQTRVHQTLTLDGKDSRIDGRLRLWHASPNLDVLVVENPSYEGLLHRRTVWFVGKQFYVFLDEAIGKAAGELCVRWTPAVGNGRIAPGQTSFTTQFPDANVLIRNAAPAGLVFEEEDGWYAWDYGQRTGRKMLRVKHPDRAPAAFLTVVAPYPGATPPEVQASFVGSFTAGDDEARISVSAFGKAWRIGRSLDKRSAWCETVADERATPATRPASGSQDVGASSAATSKPASNEPGRTTVAVAHATTLGSAAHEDEFAAIGTDSDGTIWTCWVAFDGQSDSVLAAKLDGDAASPPVVLSAAPGDHWRPAMCADGKARLWATWARTDQGKSDIWGKYFTGGKWSNAIRLTQGAGNSFGQKLAADSTGTLWMVWQSAVDGNYEILLALINPEGAGKPINVSHHPASDWEPAIAAAKDGGVWVAWDSYRFGSYDIIVAQFKDGHLSEPLGVATSPAYEAHAALAVDHQDRLWIAWDNGGVRWGEDNQDGRKLHSQRSVEIRCLARGVLAEAAEPLSAALTGPFATFCELPELSVDGGGKLWLFVRHLTDLTPKPKSPGGHVQDRGMWNPYALCYDGNRWSSPAQLPDSNGRNDMRVCTCLDRDGRLWATWADDGRTKARPPEPQNHNVHALQLTLQEQAEALAPQHPPTAPGSNAAVLETRTLGELPPLTSGREPAAAAHHPLTAGGSEYLLAYGDTHRHTDLSQCGMNHDGSLMDTYRYAIDVARLDFLAITDHDQDILKHRHGRPKSLLQHYGWWRSEKYCDLFHIEGKFIPLYAYEHGGSTAQRGGHKNVLYLERGQPCYEEDSPEKLFKALAGKQAIANPHQLADGGAATDWSKWNPEFERVAEIFQARGSYEFKGAAPPVSVSRDGHYMWDALNLGVRVGIIASSDHGMVHNAYAGVYCRDLSRAGVMEGLKSRRTFGSMDRMVIEFRLGDRLLGEEVTLNAPPVFTARIDAPESLRKVQIVKNGALVHTVKPGSLTSRFEFVDAQLQPGEQAWYYVRCEQENDKYGWSSPIWVKREQ